MTPQETSAVLAGLPNRINEVIAPWAKRRADHPALVEASGSWTYGQLAAAIDETAGWLKQQGVRAGDRVMIICENSRAFVALLLATASLDAWPVLVNARLSAREVDQIREHSGARLVLYTTAASPQSAEHAKRHGATVGPAGNLGPIGVSAVDPSAVPEQNGSETCQNVAALIYTSGTTGLPKGVMLTHRGLLFVGAIAATMRKLGPSDRIYGVLPMSHAVGLSVVLLGSLFSGATLYLASRFDPVKTLAVLDKEKLTVLLGSPSMFSLLVDYTKMKGINSLKYPDLRIISSSGAPLSSPIKASTEALFGMVLHNGYGVTECSPNIASTRLDRPRSDISVGKIFPGVEVRILNPDGEPVAAGEVGELRVRGPNVMKGYYRAAEDTAVAVDSEGWFNTRDLARIEDEHLFIVGRTKELIVRFGLNVYPAEVEAVLNAAPGVVRSAVIGRTVEGGEGGEEVIAFVQPTAGSSITEAEIAEHAAKHLAPYKRPTQIHLLETMPLTPTGKVMKDQLPKLPSLAAPHAER
jgi:acyl-CoA synthetase (AMP-forming)/AMP-acid ligase II